MKQPETIEFPIIYPSQVDGLQEMCEKIAEINYMEVARENIGKAWRNALAQVPERR